MNTIARGRVFLPVLLAVSIFLCGCGTTSAAAAKENASVSCAPSEAFIAALASLEGAQNQAETMAALVKMRNAAKCPSELMRVFKKSGAEGLTDMRYEAAHKIADHPSATFEELKHIASYKMYNPPDLQQKIARRMASMAKTRDDWYYTRDAAVKIDHALAAQALMKLNSMPDEDQ